jgi:C1A family cysteine protease
MRNSWGTNWGKKGFIRLLYGNNTCGIAYSDYYVDVERV